MIKSVIADAVAMTVVSFGVNAAPTIPQRQGKVTFNGTVIDIPRSISQKSADRSTDSRQLSKNFLEIGDASKPMDLDIELVNCDITTFKQDQAARNGKVQLSFIRSQITGQTEGLAINGDAGIAIVVQIAGKNVFFDGTAGDAYPLKDGDSAFHYTALAKKTNGGTVSEGAFSAVATSNLNYQQFI